MSASNDLDVNLRQMEEFVKEASQKGSNVIAFPEMAYFIGHGSECATVLPLYRDLVQQFSSWAKKYRIEILPGSLREPTGELPCRQYNTLLYFDQNGKQVAKYRKIYLFRATLRDRAYDETQYYDPGVEIVANSRDWGTAGFAICFDIRFPELFRGLKKKGAQVIFLPAAFAVPTGEVHWHTLIKARAIENQCFVAAPALTKACGDGRVTFGHSLIVSPWGEVLAELQQEAGLLTCDISIDDISKYKNRLDAWACRREDLFPLP